MNKYSIYGTLAVALSIVSCGSNISGVGSGSSSSSLSSFSEASDEFTGSVNILGGDPSDWTYYDPSGNRIVSADIGQTVSGKMTIVAANVSNGAWYEDNYSAHIYKNVTGNFAVAAKFKVMQADNFAIFPSSGDFKAAGFVIRDPSGSHSNNENWVMYNYGRNNGSSQREIKKTFVSGGSSRSTLYLNPQASQTEHLLVCRVGSNFYFYYYDESGSQWIQEQYISGTTTRTGSGGALAEISESGTNTMYFNHSSIGSTARVGLITHSYISGSAQVRAEIDYVRFAATAPSSQSDCTSAFTTVD